MSVLQKVGKEEVQGSGSAQARLQGMEEQINNRTAPPPAIRDIALMSGGILCKGVVLKVPAGINH